MTQPDKAKEVIGQRFKTKDQTVIDATYDAFKTQMPLDAKPSLEGAKNVIEHMRSTEVKNASTNVDDYIDPRPLESLQKDGFFAELQQRYGIR